jgi:hypothetical protein
VVGALALSALILDATVSAVVVAASKPFGRAAEVEVGAATPFFLVVVGSNVVAKQGCILPTTLLP